jgi:hypothetical protein
MAISLTDGPKPIPIKMHFTRDYRMEAKQPTIKTTFNRAHGGGVMSVSYD